MSEYRKPDPGVAAIRAWLAAHHGAEVHDLEPLPGGFWSAAWAYTVNGEALVFRIGHSGEGFAIDAAAARHFGATLPIPAVLHVGEALGFHVAISQRHWGAVLEARPEAQSRQITDLLAWLLRRLRAVLVPAHLPLIWYAQADHGTTWHDWLRASLTDHPERATHGWRQALTALPEAEAVFEASVQRIDDLLPLCPERRDLVHGDLLHQNVLVGDQEDAVTALFSWKCSVLGDWLYDLAWCTFWSPWHACIDGDALRAQVLADRRLPAVDLEHAAQRLQCYALQIAASHVGWFVWTRDMENLERLVANTRQLLRHPAHRQQPGLQ